MKPDNAGLPVAGVDGCKAGWIAAVRLPGEAPRVAIHGTMEALVDALPEETVIAVDMPIGLPDFTGAGGRGPERLVRRFLGQRQSSVFSIPSRSAIYAEPGPFASIEDWYAAHRSASEVARATSDPPRGVSIQAFGIFSKIREIDRLLIERPGLRTRLFESHPEAAFWKLNGDAAMQLPKKVRNRINEPGMEERRGLLIRCGLPADFVGLRPPRGAAGDDFLDACAMLLVAARHSRGETVSFPDPPGRDGRGLEIAIRV